MHVCTLHKLENVYLMHLEGFIELKHDVNLNEAWANYNISKAKL